MTNFNAGDKTATIDTAIPMNANYSGAMTDVAALESAFFTVTWATADQTDATLTLEISHTGVAGSWEAYPNSSYTLGSAAGVHHWNVHLGPIPYIRFAYLKGTNTTGTYSIVMRGEVPA